MIDAMSISRKANVWVKDKLAGELSETSDGSYIFQYENAYLEDTSTHPVSLTLPKQIEPYVAKILFPFFDGLIPEGWLLEIGVKNWKMDPRDRFGLLLHLCQDCIGDVSVVADEDVL